jgi:hypothetical protein
MDMRFHELYLKIAHPNTAPDAAPPPLDEFAALCREAEQVEEGNGGWLQDADNCLYAIAESPPLFAMGVSKWLTQQGSKVLVRALVHKADVRYLQHAYPVNFDLSTIPEEQRIFAGYRLCALPSTPAVSLGWVLSLASLTSGTSATKAAVEHLLKHLVDEYPLTTMRLLSSTESAFRDLAIAKEASAYLESQDAWLEEQSGLRELAMSPEMRLTLSSMKRNESREIHRHSQEKSVFASLFTAQHFKYAHKTAVEFAVGAEVKETTLEMSAYSISVELPLSERVDPVAGKVTRDRLWRGASQ